MSQFALGAVICVEHYILWKNFLDIQDGVSYTSPNKKEVLINDSFPVFSPSQRGGSHQGQKHVDG
jgi:hypothetical protein